MQTAVSEQNGVEEGSASQGELVKIMVDPGERCRRSHVSHKLSLVPCVVLSVVRFCACLWLRTLSAICGRSVDFRTPVLVSISSNSETPLKPV